MMDKNSRIFITGGTGFIGSYLIRTLYQQGYSNIIALKRRQSQLDLLPNLANKIEWIEGDLFDFEALNEGIQAADTVIHAAGKIAFYPSAKREMEKINVIGTRNIVNTCLHHNVRHLIHVSSVAAIGRNPDIPKVDEEVQFQNTALDTYYGYTKHLSELEVYRGESEGLPISIINPTMVVGSGRWNEGTARLFKTVYDGLSFYPMGCGAYVDVRDVSDMIVKMMEAGPTGDRFICSGHNRKLKTVFDTIAHNLGKKKPSRPATPFLRALAWRAEKLKGWFSGTAPIVTKETLLTSSRCFEFDNSRSISHFNMTYRPLESTLSDTCKDLLEVASNGFKSKVLPIT